MVCLMTLSTCPRQGLNYAYQQLETAGEIKLSEYHLLYMTLTQQSPCRTLVAYIQRGQKLARSVTPRAKVWLFCY